MAARQHVTGVPLDVLLERSLAHALHLHDAYTRVQYAVLPLRVVVEGGDEGKLLAWTDRVLDVAATEPSPVSRANAVHWVLMAVLGGAEPSVRRAAEALRDAACTPLRSGKRNKRGQSLLCLWATLLHGTWPGLAEELAGFITGPTLRQRYRDIASGRIDDGWDHVGSNAEYWDVRLT